MDHNVIPSTSSQSQAIQTSTMAPEQSEVINITFVQQLWGRWGPALANQPAEVADCPQKAQRKFWLGIQAPGRI